MYDLVIVGGGPAGLTAAVYAIHKRMETLLITQDLGGKARYSFQLDEMEGHELIPGRELVEKFRAQIEYLDFVYTLAEVTKVDRKKDHFVVTTGDGKTYEAMSTIIATGARTPLLDVPGAREMWMRGLSYSAISHAPMFLDRAVALVGKGERALRAVAELSLVADKVTFLAQEALPDSPLAKHIAASPRVEVLEGYTVQEVVGGEAVGGLVIGKDGDWQELEIQGLFVELGLEPASEVVQHLVECTEAGFIKTDCLANTNVPGLFAAGDVAAGFDEQILVAVGAGATAALSAYEYLLTQGLLPSWMDEAPEELSSTR